MVGYVNASLSVFRVSDFEERSQPGTTGELGEDVKHCRYWRSTGFIHIWVYAVGGLGEPSLSFKTTTLGLARQLSWWWYLRRNVRSKITYWS